MLPSRVRQLLANKAAAATYLIGLPTIAIAFAAAWSDTNRAELPGALRWIFAAVAVCSFLLLASESYAVLLPRQLRANARGAFLTSQLVKYNPLGVPAQMASQVALAPERAAESAQSVMRSKLTAVAGGVIWAPVCALSATDLPVMLRIGIGAIGFAVIVGHPRVSRFMLALFARLAPRVGVVHVDRRMLIDHLGSTFFGAAAAGSLGAAFALLVAVDGGALTIVASISAYAVAWTVGYVAVPFPGGIGVREGTLLLIAPFAASEVFVAAVLLRLTQVAIEILLATIGASMLSRTSDATG